MSNPESNQVSSLDPYQPLSWYLQPGHDEISPKAHELLIAERTVPVRINEDLSLRPKIIDACGMTCDFCHNEGTPVRTDNILGKAPDIGPGRSGRVSIFVRRNGVDFLPGRMEPNNDFSLALSSLKTVLGLEEVHLTGGEPTLHPNLPALVDVSSQLGYRVNMTSNGENGGARIRESALRGLGNITFSIFGTTPEELATTQGPKYGDNLDLAAKRIQSLKESIDIALENKVRVSANIVVPNIDHTQKVINILDGFNPELGVKILNSLDDGDRSYYAIYELLSELDAEPNERIMTAGSSSTRVSYILPDGRKVYFKQIRPARLPEICNNCQFNNPDDCKEGLYGLRLYVDTNGTYKVGVCIQRMDLSMDLDKFVDSDLPAQIVQNRKRELSEMTSYFEPLSE